MTYFDPTPEPPVINPAWQWWADRLAGESLIMSEGTPHAGFYRWVRKQGYGGIKYAIPVAYWPAENGSGELNCRIGDDDVTPMRGRDIWVNVGNHPVSEAWYRGVAQDDRPEWPDGMAVEPPEGSNLPPDVDLFEELNRRVEAEDCLPQALLHLADPPISKQTDADIIANCAERLAEIWKQADEGRKAERKPHDEALKAIQTKWAPLLIKAERYKDLKYKITAWLLKEKNRLKEEAEQAAAAGQPAAAETRRPRAGTRNRTIALKTSKRADITDYDKCLAFFKENPDVKAAVQDCANRAVRSGIDVPGVTVIEEERAV